MEDPFPKPSWTSAVEEGLLVDVSIIAHEVGFMYTTYFSMELYLKYKDSVRDIIATAKREIIVKQETSAKLNFLYQGDDLFMLIHALEDRIPTITFMFLEQY